MAASDLPAPEGSAPEAGSSSGTVAPVDGGSTPPQVAVQPSAGQKPKQAHGTKNCPLPSHLTPKMQKAIRIFSTGVSAPEACKISGVGIRYFHRVMKAPLGRDYFDQVSKKVETAFIDKASAVASANAGKQLSVEAVQLEIDEAVLESVQELRAIVKSSKSDQARAAAAKELLDLAQAKKRYMASKAGEDTDTALTAADIDAYTKTTRDLLSIHAIISRADADAAALAAAAPDAHNDDPIVRAVEAASESVATITDIAALDADPENLPPLEDPADE